MTILTSVSKHKIFVGNSSNLSCPFPYRFKFLSFSKRSLVGHGRVPRPNFGSMSVSSDFDQWHMIAECVIVALPRNFVMLHVFIICQMTRKHLLKLLCWVTISRMIMSEMCWNLNVPFHIAAWYPAAVTRRWAKRYDSPSRTAGLLQDPSFTTSSWLLHVFWRWLPLLIWDFNSDIMA